jgi:hypothetical protein
MSAFDFQPAKSVRKTLPWISGEGNEDKPDWPIHVVLG